MSAPVENDPEFRDALPKPTPRRGLHLRDLLAIVAIIAVLIAFLLPATRSSRPAALRAQCTNNLRLIMLALQNYEQAYKCFPPAHTTDAEGRPLHGWRTLILPYLEQEALYRTIDLSKPWNDPANARARETPLSVFRCPAATGPPNTTTYLAIVGPDACLLPDQGRPRSEIRDATDATLMVIEAAEENAVPWMAPVDANESLVMGLGSTGKLHHTGGTNAGLVSGSVAFLKARTPAQVLRALTSISGHDDAVARTW